MKSPPLPFPAIAVLIAIAFLGSACTSVLRTSSFDSQSHSEHPAYCDASTVGAYALPKSEIKFAISKSEQFGAQSYTYEMKHDAADDKDGLELVSVAGASQIHCLDFLSNPLYADAIRVKRSPDLLLETVTSNNIDRTPDIAEKVAESVVVAAAQRSGLRNLNSEKSSEVDFMQMQFDPFDVELLSQANKALRSAGYCIYIDPSNDPHVPFWMRNQCSSKKVYQPYTAKVDSEAFFRSGRYAAGEGRIGILYRPLLSHTLVILKKDDPTSALPWYVWRREIVQMPNRAPVFQLGVKRGLFTTRKTTLTFDKGTLLSVEIDKQSELKALSDAVVSIVGIVVQLPAKALILRTSEVEAQAELIKVNQLLLENYDLLQKARDENAALNDPNRSAASRSGVSRSVLDKVALEACVQNAELTGIADPTEYCQTREASQ